MPKNNRTRRFKKPMIDDKKAMVLSQIKEVHHHADELAKVLANMDTVDAWVVGKMERATTDLSDITHYLDGTTEYAKGGMMSDEMMSQKKVLFYRNKLVQMNVGKDSSALDFAIRIIDSMVDKDDEDYVFLTSLQNNKKALFYRNKLVQMNVGKNSSALDFAIKLIDMAYDGELKMAKGGEVKSKTKKYQILSPDGFTIEREVPYYTSKNKAMSAFDKWKENYSRQGYYSSVRYGRIDLSDLADYCQFITL